MCCDRITRPRCLPESKLGSTQLCNLPHLKELLEGVTMHDPLKEISLKYKTQLDGALADKLIRAAPLMELDKLVPAIKDLLLKSCVGEHTDANADLRASLDWIEVDVGGEKEFLSDVAWYDTHFPEGMLMMYAFDVYSILNEAA